MATDDNLLDLEMGDGIFDDTGRIDVVAMHGIGNVAVDEDLARLAMADGRLWNARVCASYPQNLWRLALCQVDEGIRISLGGALGIDPISGKQVVQRI